MRRLTCFLFVISVLSVSLAAESLIRSGIEKEAVKYRPLRSLFHSLTPAQRVAIYNKALALFEGEIRGMGMRLTASDREYWKKIVGPWILKKTDLLSPASANDFVDRALADTVVLYRDVIRLCRQAAGNADTLVASLGDYMQKRRAWMDDLRGRLKRLSQITKESNFDAMILLKLVKKHNFLDVFKEFKAAAGPYNGDVRAKALLEKVQSLK